MAVPRQLFLLLFKSSSKVLFWSPWLTILYEFGCACIAGGGALSPGSTRSPCASWCCGRRFGYLGLLARAFGYLPFLACCFFWRQHTYYCGFWRGGERGCCGVCGTAWWLRICLSQWFPSCFWSS